MSAMSEAVSKAVRIMDKKQFRAEKMYRISLSVARSMLEKGIISKEEKISRIEPAVPAMPKRKKAAAYARVSRDTERLMNSVSAQINY